MVGSRDWRSGGREDVGRAQDLSFACLGKSADGRTAGSHQGGFFTGSFAHSGCLFILYIPSPATKYEDGRQCTEQCG